MAVIKAFKGIRPGKEFADKIASQPYDVVSSDEARELVKDNPLSFHHVIKPEVDLPLDVDIYSEEVYETGKKNLERLINEGYLKEDDDEYLYIYAQSLKDNIQYGIVGCASVDDYINKVIKEHELTRPDKEEDRTNHIRYTKFHAEPVFFAFKDNKELSEIIDNTVSEEPVYDFITSNEVGHHFWVIREKKIIARIIEIFEKDIENTYVADGHHRTAAAVNFANELRESNPDYTGEEQFNYFLAVHFPASHLHIIDYNRVIKDLNSLSKEQFIEKISESFEIENKGVNEYKPQKFHEFSMYIDGEWYKLTAKQHTYDECHPIDCLDVTILFQQVFKPILGVEDLRKSKRIDFVGGIRGLSALQKRVDSGEMIAAFALYPVSMEQLMNIADAGDIMPPKTTWFEPKLRSGLVLHKIM